MPLQIDHRHVVRLLAIGRIGLGVAMLAMPGRALRTWIGDASSSGGTQVVIRALGVRDVALGAGTLRALDSGDPSVREWVTASAACDAIDSIATVRAMRALSLRGRMVGSLVAGASAAALFVARDRMGR